MRKLIPDNLAIWRRAALALPAPAHHSKSNDDLRNRLVADFNRARYGLTFRSCAFPGTVPGETEYFRALATTIDLDCWDIQKISSRDMQMESPAHPVETPNIKLRAVKTGLGFFEALEYLARFEASQTTPPAGTSKESLGNEHYQAFGLLHDIAFNMQGLPQPTIGGHIAINDEYPVAVLSQLEDSQKNTAEKSRLKAATTVLARANASHITAGFAALERQTQDYANLKDVYDNHVLLWKDLFKYLFKSDDFTISRHEKTSLHVKKHAIEGEVFGQFMSGPPYKATRFIKLFVESSKAVKAAKLEQADKDLILSFLDEITLFGLLEDAKRTSLYINERINNSHVEVLSQIADQYAGLGLKSRPKSLFLQQQIADKLAHSFKNKRREYFLAAALAEPPAIMLPDHIMAFGKDVETLVENAAKKAQKTWSALSPTKSHFNMQV